MVKTEGPHKHRWTKMYKKGRQSRLVRATLFATEGQVQVCQVWDTLHAMQK